MFGAPVRRQMVTRLDLALVAQAWLRVHARLVGTYPALLNRNAEEFRHQLHTLDSEDEVKLVLLNDFVVSRDLPTAYRQFRRQAGLER
jgi:hypothetical protein